MKLSACTPTVWLLPEVDQRLRAWVDIASGEMSALGLVEKIAGGFLVTKIFLPKQTCGPAETELDQAAIAQLLAELDATGDDVAKLRLWAHSHAAFRCFWSGTDEATVRHLANDDWTLALVINKTGEQRCRLDVWKPTHVTLDELPVSVFHEDLGLRAACEALYKERVTEVSLSVPGISSAVHLAPSRSDRDRLDLLDGRLEARSEQVRYPDLDWGDIDDLLDPTLDDERGPHVTS